MEKLILICLIFYNLEGGIIVKIVRNDDWVQKQISHDTANLLRVLFVQFVQICIKFRTVTRKENLQIKKSLKFIFSKGGFSESSFSLNGFVSRHFTLQPWWGTVLFISIRNHNNQLLRYSGVWEPLHLLLNRNKKMGTENFYMQLTSCFTLLAPLSRCPLSSP